MKSCPLLFLALLAAAATAADPPKNLFEGGSFESWDEATGLPTATAWCWSLPKDPFTAMERATNEWRSGAGSLHLRDDSSAKENQTLGHVIGKDELAKLRGNASARSRGARRRAASLSGPGGCARLPGP